MPAERKSELPTTLAEPSRFLVCGLGSLGQFCVASLKEFGVSVSAITRDRVDNWEIPNLPDLLDDLLMGDCRQPDLLTQVGVQQCRAVLLVASDERINIEAAFAVRVLNPQVRLIVRSSKHNLNQLLTRGLGNFVALEASHLPAPAFAIAALGSEIRGVINLNDSMLRVVKVPIEADHRWCDRRQLHELNTPTRRVLSHIPAGMPLPVEFHQWQPDARIQAGDQVAYIELTESLGLDIVIPRHTPRRRPKNLRQWLQRPLSRQYWQQKLLEFWQATAQQQSKRVALIVGCMMLSLLLIGTLVLQLTHPHINLLQAFYVSGVMLLGSYDTVYGALTATDSFPLWMRLLNLSYMLAGTASIAVLYALLTETLLAAKFQLPKKRPPLPLQDHVVLIGIGRVGRRVAAFLQNLKQPIVGVNNTPLESTLLPNMPLVLGEPSSTLNKVNLATAKSVVVMTDDEMLNLEIGLMAHAANPDCALVIRTFDPRFSDSIDRLLPYAKVLCAYGLAAEAFVASAFGEHVINLLRLNEQTILVTEYGIAADDTLHGKLLADVAYGYGVVPILHQKSQREPARLMPTDDVRLEVGDRLVVLATINSLQRVERGALLPRTWHVQLDRTLAQSAAFDGATTLTRITDCSINQARDLMQQLPTLLPLSLYQHQAQRLVRELGKVQVIAHVVDARGTV